MKKLAKSVDLDDIQMEFKRDLKQYLLPAQRVDIIYHHKIHKWSPTQISKVLGLSFTTVIDIIKGHRENGRLFKLLPKHSKRFILK